MTPESGRRFFKMSGSGNDFVMFDARHEPPGQLAGADRIAALCARGTGVGADGVVFLVPSQTADVGLAYYNADGSLADLCGNATLCTTRLAAELGAADGAGMTIETGAGVLAARIRADGAPEIDLQPVAQWQADAPSVGPLAGEGRVGFALAGVPHLTVLVDDLATVDVGGRGRQLRWHPSLAQGANVNFVQQRQPGVFGIRTYERGVEGETLACGTGAVASAILLQAWGLAESPVSLLTRSGRRLSVTTRRDGDRWFPSLSGAAVLVFEGVLREG
jgi:diaminopimelate epimerase